MALFRVPFVPPAIWQPIETAPKGGGADYVNDPALRRAPPMILVAAGQELAVVRWDAYYAPGGRGFRGDDHAWTERGTGEPVDWNPTHWQPRPPGPEE